MRWKLCNQMEAGCYQANIASEARSTRGSSHPHRRVGGGAGSEGVRLACKVTAPHLIPDARLGPRLGELC